MKDKLFELQQSVHEAARFFERVAILLAFCFKKPNVEAVRKTYCLSQSQSESGWTAKRPMARIRAWKVRRRRRGIRYPHDPGVAGS